MTYEPRGKVKSLCDAMAPQPQIALPASRCAHIMGVPQSALPAYLDAPIRHKALYSLAFNEKRYYALTPGAKPAPTEPLGAAPIHLETTANGWRPPKMECTRPTAGATVPQVVQEQREPAGDAGATPAPHAEAPLLTIELDGEVQFGGNEMPAADGGDGVDWCLWSDGDVDLFGLQELEGGGYRMPRAALERFRKYIAWMPA